ncbi:MAG: hypothetical protein AB1801_29040, partial [Chloroflexota bacterium]
FKKVSSTCAEEGDKMKTNYWRRSGLILGVLVLLILAVNINALAQGEETIYVTNPTAGQSVTGLITITGAVDFADFQKYELFLKTGDELLWAATVYAPVINGNLARLDTRTVPDGAYQLVIRQVRTDSNYTEFNGPTFFIENNLGAPLPYPEVESSLLYPPEAGALMRVRNCGGDNLEFDYNSPAGFCSADQLLIPFKHADSTICPFADVLLKPCEYRGTARGQGLALGATYSFMAEAGKIYELTFPGNGQIYIAEVKGDERAETDTAALDRGDPARVQPATSVAEAAQSEAVVVADKTPPPASAPPVVAPQPSGADSAETETMLPVSGQDREINIVSIVSAVGLILLLLVGGFMATRQRRYPA